MREHPAVRVLFDAINIMFFDDALLPPELFMDDNVPFAGCYLRSEGEDCIIINAELLQPSASFYDLVHTIWHEATHQFCENSGIPHAGKNGYHRAGFRDAARAHGLRCEWTSHLGWTCTGLIPENRDRVVNMTRTVLDRLLKERRDFFDTEYQ